MRKSPLIRSVLFLLPLAVLIAAAGWVFFPKNNTWEDGLRFPTASGFVTEPENSVDFAVIGDSLPFYGLNPRLIFTRQGIPGYCCVKPQMDMAEAREMLTLLLQYQSPRMILLEADTLYRQMDTTEPVSQALQSRVPLLRYHSNWKTLSPRQLLRPIRWSFRYPDKGFYSCDTTTPVTPGNYMAGLWPQEPISPEASAILAQMQDICREKGIALRLISVPSAVSWNRTRHDQVEALASRLDLRYLDMNLEDLGIDWSSDCLDGGDHLNVRGAAKASAFLGAYLAQTGLFTDRRADPICQSWLLPDTRD